MGNATSRNVTTNENNQLYVSKTAMNILSENVNTAVSNALMTNNASCSSINRIDQVIAFSCQAGGDLNIGMGPGGAIRQDAMVTVDFSCVNAFNARHDMAQAILSEI